MRPLQGMLPQRFGPMCPGPVPSRLASVPPRNLVVQCVGARRLHVPVSVGWPVSGRNPEQRRWAGELFRCRGKVDLR